MLIEFSHFIKGGNTMNIEEIIKYTQKTPENTNPNMLRNMLG
jgi:hypothetical protein